MVPQFRPQAALNMIAKLVNYELLSPLLPSNETLLAMTNDEFNEALDKWTETAKGPPFV